MSIYIGLGLLKSLIFKIAFYMKFWGEDTGIIISSTSI